MVTNSTGGPWVPGIYTHPQRGGPFDLAFELTTYDLPATGTVWQVPVRFMDIDMDRPLAGQVMLTATGYCGCGTHVLQASTNLVAPDGGWQTVVTNVAPRPVNTWAVPAIETQRMFRIRSEP